MTKTGRSTFVLTGRNATSFLLKSENPKSAVCAKTNSYLAHVNNTVTVSQRGGTIRISSSGEKFK